MTDVLVSPPAEQCPDCHNTLLVTDEVRGELTCTLCGLVLQDKRIDLGPEWRSFDPYAQKNQDNPTRTGDLITLLKLPFTSTEMGDPKKPQSRHFARLAKVDRRTKLSVRGFANLQVAIAEICRLCSQLRVSRKVAAAAALCYRKAMAQELHRGNSILGVATAAVYMTVRQQGLLITLPDILQFSKLTKKELSRCFSLLRRELDQNPAPHDLKQFVQRVSTTLKLSRFTTLTALDLIDQVKAKRLTIGKKPAVIVAATIYVASLLTRERLTQKQIGEVAQVTEVAIRNNYKEIAITLELDFEVPLAAPQREGWG